MTITIYDYASKETKIALPDKEILRICVTVISGDETGWVEFTDGSRTHFDASDCRIVSFYDGNYIVEGEDIEKWLNFVPSERTASYERQEIFY
jgi:hypothetical protein